MQSCIIQSHSTRQTSCCIASENYKKSSSRGICSDCTRGLALVYKALALSKRYVRSSSDFQWQRLWAVVISWTHQDRDTTCPSSSNKLGTMGETRPWTLVFMSYLPIPPLPAPKLCTTTKKCILTATQVTAVAVANNLNEDVQPAKHRRIAIPSTIPLATVALATPSTPYYWDTSSVAAAQQESAHINSNPLLPPTTPAPEGSRTNSTLYIPGSYYRWRSQYLMALPFTFW